MEASPSRDPGAGGASLEAWRAEGRAAEYAGDVVGAIRAWQKVVEAAPGAADTWNDLGNVLRRIGRSAEALACYDAGLAAAPEVPELHSNRAAVLLDLGRCEEAEVAARGAVARRQGYARAWFNLGNAQWRQGRPEEALASFLAAVEGEPDLAPAWNNLGNLCVELGRLDDAASCFARARALNPQDPLPAANRASVLRDLGDVAGAEAELAAARELAPGDAAIGSAWLFLRANREDAEPAALRAEHAAWERDLGGVRARPSRRGGGGGCRVAFLSPDLRDHAVATFAVPVIEALVDLGVEVVLAPTIERTDAVTEALRARVARWVPVARLDDAAAAALLRREEADVLIDLAGHTSGHRLGVVRLGAAPVQATWLGYFATTGVAAMDWWIGDREVFGDPGSPGASEVEAVERLCRLPRCWKAYRPPAAMPAEVPEPMQAKGSPVVFGSFNDLRKVGPRTIAAWAAVLREVRGSRLVLRAGRAAEARHLERIRAALVAVGVAEERVRAEGRLTVAEHFAAHAAVDVALDSVPIGGGATTAHALWLGVPVVAMRGSRYAARISSGVLVGAGCGEWVADDEAGYVERAVELARRVDAVRSGRVVLRERVAASELGDPRGLAEAILAAAASW